MPVGRGVPGGAVLSVGESAENLMLMRLLDGQYMRTRSQARRSRAVCRTRGIAISMDGKSRALDIVFVGQSGSPHSFLVESGAMRQ
jgi:hypothetical protein